MSHEELLTSVVGSHAHPGWFAAGIAAAERGEYGPADLAELLDDGVDLAIRDQERAGIDVITDGEMRRAGFFTAEFYRHLTGVRALPPTGGSASAPTTRCTGSRSMSRSRPRTASASSASSARPAADGAAAQGDAARAVHAVRAGCVTGPGEVYETRVAAAEAFVPILQAELRGLVDAGADDHPGRRAVAGDPPRRAGATSRRSSTRRSSRSAAGVRLGAHLCFGNFLGRPLAPRSYRPILRRDARLRTSTSSSSSSRTAR